MAKTTVTYRIDKDLKESLSAWCEERDIPQSLVYRLFVEALLEGVINIDVLVSWGEQREDVRRDDGSND